MGLQLDGIFIIGVPKALRSRGSGPCTKAETCEPLKGPKRLLSLVEHFAVLCYSAEAGKESELTK